MDLYLDTKCQFLLSILTLPWQKFWPTNVACSIHYDSSMQLMLPINVTILPPYTQALLLSNVHLLNHQGSAWHMCSFIMPHPSSLFCWPEVLRGPDNAWCMTLLFQIPLHLLLSPLCFSHCLSTLSTDESISKIWPYIHWLHWWYTLIML
jgi:hypothetical protein